MAATIQSMPAGDLIGTQPPEWQVDHWMHSEPLRLSDLKGRVVLVRWWTAPGCPYCAATAPSLNQFHEESGKRGLVVIGFYHHKTPGPLDLAEVRGHVKRFGFRFPIAVDPEWRTLNQWWLEAGDDQDSGRKWTSVSFLIGRDGRIGHIHPGGEYPPGSADHAVMKAKIEELLKAPAAP